MEQQIQQGQRKQKSLLWIIVVLYLIIFFSGLVGGLIATFLITKIIFADALFNSIGGGALPEFFFEINVALLFSIILIAKIIALVVGINYIIEKTIIPRAHVMKISFWVAAIGVIIALASRIIFLGFNLWDLLILVEAAIIYFAAKYFLSKKAI
jgi:hypothetical protein